MGGASSLTLDPLDGMSDQHKLTKALAIWTAQKLGVTLLTARTEILAIYRELP